MPIPYEFVYGVQPVLQVFLAKRRRAVRLFYHRTHFSPELKYILALAKKESLPIEEVDRHRLSQMAKTPQHQGVLLYAEPYPYVPLEDFIGSISSSAKNSLILILDQIQDPQNLGAILRSAHCAGVDGVILPERGSALVNATVLKASAGGGEFLSVVLVKNLGRAIDFLKEISIWIYGAEAGTSSPYYEQNFDRHTALVLGNEGMGLRKNIREKCDFLISIPLRGKIDSLNVSVTAGVLLFEVLKQRKSQ